MIIRIDAKDKRAEITIYGTIGQGFFEDGVTAEQFRKDLNDLGDVEHIDVYINSPGGNVWDGLSIANILSNHPATVHAQIDGLAASIASVIAVSADRVVMGTGAAMMVHSPHALFAGNANEMRDFAEVLDKVETGMLDVYEEGTGKPRDELKSLLDAETWFTAQEAVDAGFADETTKIKAKEKPEASWDVVMACFKNTPQEFTTPQKAAASNQSAKAGAIPTEGTMTTKVTASEKDTDKAVKAAAKTAREEERTRVSDITALCGKFKMDAEFIATAIDDGLSKDQVNALILDQKYESTQGGTAGHAVSIEDQRDKFKEGAVNALLARTGQMVREEDNEFNGLSLARLAEHSLIMAGVSVRGLSADGVARKVLASLSSSDFPNLLSGVASKMLRTAYENFPSTYQLWCAIGDVPDFKASPRIQLGSFNSLAVIPEGGEYTYGSFDEESESVTAQTKGKGLKLTRQMIVNDDLNGFNRRAQMLGRAAARTVNNDAYTLLTSGTSNNGPTMADSGQMFNSTAVTTGGGHANLASSGGAPTVATISAGRAAMRKQKDAGLKDTLNIMPRSILTSVGLEDTVWALLNSTADFSNANSGKKNFLADVARLELVTDPYLDGISSTAWWLAADPMDAPLLEVAFLNGQQTPFIDEDFEWSTDALLMKVRLDYGLSGIDWRAGYKNAGA